MNHRRGAQLFQQAQKPRVVPLRPEWHNSEPKSCATTCATSCATRQKIKNNQVNPQTVLQITPLVAQVAQLV